MKTYYRFCLFSVFLVLAAFSASSCLAQAAATTTALSIAPGASVGSGTTITLAAYVASNGVPFHAGTVLFCKADSPHCEDSALLGSAQVASGGWAKLRLRLGVGTYSVKAVFLGTPGSVPARLGSASAAQNLVVKGRSSTVTSSVSAEFANDVYKLVSRVAVFGREPISGSLSFEDSVDGATPVSLGYDTLVPQNTVTGFTASALTPIGNDDDAFAVADFNQDGIPDLVSTNYESNQLSILLGKGDGTFLPLPRLAADYEPDQVATGDFNADGIADIAVTYRDAANVAVMLGKGDGTFTAANHFSAGPDTQSIVVADVNGDGILDIVTGNVSSQTISTLLGNGDGTFAAPVNLGIPAEPFGLLTADFNRDGIPDLAVSGSTDTFILLGKGDGTFSVASMLGAGESGSTVLADFNGDGSPDVATLYYPGSYPALSVYLSNGDGNFTLTSTPITSTAGTPQPVMLLAADFNGDGVPDIAVDEFSFSTLNSAVTVLLGAGDGAFPRTTTPVQAELIHAGVVADYNSDGIPDMLLESYNDQVSKTSLGVLLGAQVTTGALHNVFLYPPGAHSITPSYSGSSTLFPSAGPSLSLNVAAAGR